VDTETTGLDPERHELWDIALIEADGTEHEWHIAPVHPELADPTSLRLTDFYQRTASDDWRWSFSNVGTTLLASSDRAAQMRQNRYGIASEIALLTAGKHLVGAVPSFDAAFLGRFLVANGQREAWHYHLVDIEALAAGRLGIAPPWDSDDLARRLGCPRLDGKHTAIGDARWAKAMYEAALDPGTVIESAA
jgi:hypothetical protein